jgi:PleD family two-component response regulator
MTLIPSPDQRTRPLEENWLAGSPWYQRAYFEERVGQELYRSQRYKIETSILLIRIPAISRRAARSLYTYVSTQLRTIDTAGMLGTGDYVVCLPHTPHKGAEVVAGRVRAFLDEYAPQVGVASFGADGKDFEALLATAEARIA